MLKLKFFGHLMRRENSSEKTPTMGETAEEEIVSST